MKKDSERRYFVPTEVESHGDKHTLRIPYRVFLMLNSRGVDTKKRESAEQELVIQYREVVKKQLPNARIPFIKFADLNRRVINPESPVDSESKTRKTLPPSMGPVEPARGEIKSTQLSLMAIDEDSPPTPYQIDDAA